MMQDADDLANGVGERQERYCCEDLEFFLIDSEYIKEIRGYDKRGDYGILRYELPIMIWHDDWEYKEHWEEKQINYCPFCGAKL